MKFLNRHVLLGLSLLSPTLFLTDGQLVVATPANGAVVNGSPELIKITIDTAVKPGITADEAETEHSH